MKYTTLGKTGLEISTIGFGAWGISGRDWGQTDDEESKKAINEALDRGVNFLDTADTYGSGHSEELISEVIKERGKPDNLVIATKAGNNFYPYLGEKHATTPGQPDYSQKYLIYAAEQSIKRLGVEALDIWQLHSPNKEILKRDEPWIAMDKMKQDGKIRFGGWSVQSFQETAQADILDEHYDLLDTIQFRYNLLEREAEKELLPKMQQHNIGGIVRIPILFGVLAGKYGRDDRFGKDDHRQWNLAPDKLNAYMDKLEKLQPFFDKYKDQYSMAQLSLRFTISHPACHVSIPGGKNPQQVAENVAASDMDFPTYEEFPKAD